MPNHYTTMAICSPGYEFDIDNFNEKHSETCLCSVVKPMPERIEDISCIYYSDGTTEQSRRGEDTNAIDWARNNWGTKWGTYGCRAFQLGGDHAPVMIEFQSAWTPPAILGDIAEWMHRIGDFSEVSFVGFNPYDSSTNMLGAFEFEVNEA